MHITPLSSRRVLLLSFLVLLLAAAWTWHSRLPAGTLTAAGIPAPREGFAAPDLTLTTMQGETRSLAALRGQPVLVNFWASWCLPCKSEMPAFQRAYQDYHSQGFEILAVNALAQDSLEKATQFVADHKLSFSILLDGSGKALSAYQVSSFPTSFFIDRQGIVREVVVGGPMTEAMLRIRIENLLGGLH